MQISLLTNSEIQYGEDTISLRQERSTIVGRTFLVHQSGDASAISRSPSLEMTIRKITHIMTALRRLYVLLRQWPLWLLLAAIATLLFAGSP